MRDGRMRFVDGVTMTDKYDIPEFLRKRPPVERPILFSKPMVKAILAGTKSQTRRVVKCDETIAGLATVEQWAGALADNFAPHPTDEMIKTKADGLRGRLFPLVNKAGRMFAVPCPYGQPGDRLWVRETCRAVELPSGLDGVRYIADDAFIPIENSSSASEKWMKLASYGMKKSGRTECRTVPAIHMPRWASRILLEVTGVRVERLNDISGNDAAAEGVQVPCDTQGRPLLRLTGLVSPLKFLDGRPQGWTADDFLRFEYVELWEQINGHGSWAANPWVWVVEFKRLKP